MRLQTLSLAGAVSSILSRLPAQRTRAGAQVVDDEDLDHEAVDPDHDPQPVEDAGDDGG